MLNLELEWDRPARAGSATTWHVLRIRIHPSPVQAGLPMRMAVALDTSGSMQGIKLDHAKTACEAVAGLLRPEDRLWLAGYSGTLREICCNLPGGRDAQMQVRSTISGLQATGVTRMDLALEWIRAALPIEDGTTRFGVLITDGHATDPKGKPLEGDPLSALLEIAGGVNREGITLCAVGLGDADHFNTEFLKDLTDKGRGAFVYAPDPTGLAAGLEERFRAAQSTAANQARVRLKPLRPGIDLGAACRLRPTFVALEPSERGPETAFAIGALASHEPTDMLVYVQTSPLGFGEKLGTKDVLEVTVDADGSQASANASIEWTNSLITAQSMNNEVDRDRLLWQVNDYTSRLQRTNDPLQTAELLKNIADDARAAGRNDIADRATKSLEELAKEGKLPADRKTKMLSEVRKTGVLT